MKNKRRKMGWILAIVCLISLPLQAQEAQPGAGNGALGQQRDNLDITRIKDWDLVCAKSGQPCMMAQIGKDSKGTPIMEMRIRLLPEPKEVEGRLIVALAEILTPLGVMLIPGIEMQIDLGPVYAANYQLCTETGCLVSEPLAEETVKALKAGSKATVSLVAAAQGEVRATLSLKGFTKAFDSLK